MTDPVLAAHVDALKGELNVAGATVVNVVYGEGAANVKAQVPIAGMIYDINVVVLPSGKIL